MKSEYDEIYFLHLKQIREKDLGDIMCIALDKIKGLSAEEILNITNQQDEIPVNLDVIMDKLRIKRFATSFDEIEKKENKKVSGLVLLNEKDIGIFYRKNSDLRKKRFIIAHELGHCCLHGDMLEDDYIDFYSEDTIEEEYEKSATAFAMRLLIPEQSIQKISSKILKPSIKILSEIFQVPESLMYKRVTNLNIVFYPEEE